MKKYYPLLLVLLFTRSIYSQQYILETVVSGLSTPVAFVFLPNNNVIITQKAGLSKIYTLNNVFVSNFWDFTDSTNSGGERGLLGVCLDPNYSTNHFVYFYYNHNPNWFRVVRLTENNNIGINPFIVCADTGLNGAIHVGGNIRFGRDNKLYITIGNNGTSSNSQSLSTFKGKMLRINSDGTIPTDNPFWDDGNPHTGNDDRIWAYGLRNSFDFCFSPVNDSLYATENGDGNPDEINFIRRGKNYGYPFCSGYCNPYNPLYQNPMTEIPGNGFGDYAPTGIMIYTASQMPELTGKAIVIGSGAGQIFRGLLKCDLGNPPFYDTIVAKTILLDITGYTTLMQGSDGFIYALKLSGVLQRIKHDPSYVNNESTPSVFLLEQNYPNPFNPKTNIKYQIANNSRVIITIYDMLSREVMTLIDKELKAGSYEIEWDATNFPSGVYYYVLRAGGYTETKKMVILK